MHGAVDVMVVFPEPDDIHRLRKLNRAPPTPPAGQVELRMNCYHKWRGLNISRYCSQVVGE